MTLEIDVEPVGGNDGEFKGQEESLPHLDPANLERAVEPINRERETGTDPQHALSIRTNQSLQYRMPAESGLFL